jgi:hypothetical protein
VPDKTASGSYPPPTEILTESHRAELVEALLWQRSVYSFIETKPSPELESFGAAFSRAMASLPISTTALVRHPAVALAANLIRRRGDIALYEGGLRHELASANAWRGATMSGSLFVGYFSAAKSLLDAVSIVLTAAYSLPLAPKEQDFAKAKFWNALHRVGAVGEAELDALRGFTADVVRWRDAAVHRTTPLVVVDANMDQIGFKPPDQILRHEVRIIMAADPDADFSIFGDALPRWVDPMDRPNEWRPKLEAIAQIAAEAVMKMTTLRGSEA